MKRVVRALAAIGVIATLAVRAASPTDTTANFGPYNVTILEGGVGISRALSAPVPEKWSLTGWVELARERSGTVVIASLGDAPSLLLQDGRPTIALARGARIAADTALRANVWTAIAATYDGQTARLYVDGREVGASNARRRSGDASTSTTARVPAAVSATAHAPSAVSAAAHEPAAAGATAHQPAAAGGATSSTASATFAIAPVGAGPAAANHFGGSLALFQLHQQALSAEAIAKLAAAKPNFDLIVFNTIGAGWPWQLKAWRGLQEPQDPWTLPQSKTPPSKPVATPPLSTSAIQRDTNNLYTLASWRMAEAPNVTGTAEQISQPAYRDDDWLLATVPGTALTTLIDRGVYPDPDYGLNNLAIPERLARQDYWYRTQFTLPPELIGRALTLRLKGINYHADVWANGAHIGDVTGAFIRGTFDVTRYLKAGQPNVIAIRVSPPPHPGIPHEESIQAGPGENGGWLAIDGPTFVASEGWDWIPGIRDRNTGLWQAVELQATGPLRLLDPHVVTTLPLPQTDHADVSITVPVENANSRPTAATIDAQFEGVRVSKPVTLPPGKSDVEFTKIRVDKPRLWWPNGYGPANLYTLQLTVRIGSTTSDTTQLRFGIRHITYELSLFDSTSRLRRVEVDPNSAERLIDVRHAAIKKIPNGWAESLTPAGEKSPAVRDVPTESLSPYLAIHVNGVPIAARGGNWGTDDSRKRIDRARLEPYFRLHRDANLNIIRNWLGQNTEDVFYDLADEYGLLVLNDFWESTQDFQVEVQDPALFLANARDVISRYRNHPSIAVWFGRNEGVPQPIINEGLASLVAELDGTRYYTGSSNNVNLQGSGPYNYRPPEGYFTSLAQGFSVEVGTPSLSTLESLHASIPPADRWPLSDTIAYHDWHFGGNGDVATFMQTLAAQFGEATSLEDFERKAQMMNLVTYRAVFEGFNAHLWTKNSGRLLWMTHPSWPSNAWQIYSSDYDTHAAYYGVKAACEPVHAQMNLPDFRLAVVNTTRELRAGLTLRSRVVSLDNRVLADRTDKVSASANAVTSLSLLPLQPLLDKERIVLVSLKLTDATGAVISTNTYWQGRDDSSYRRLNELPKQALAVNIKLSSEPDERVLTAELANNGRAPALAAKLTLVDESGQRILPARYTDNYVTLLPGERKRVEIRFPLTATPRLALRGWNIEPATITPVPGT